MKEEKLKPSIVIPPIAAGKQIVAHLIFIRIETHSKTYHAVVLPSAALPESSALAILAEVGQALNGNTFNVRIHDVPEYE